MNKQLYAGAHEYRPADEADFINRDRPWYDQAQSTLSAAGFQHLIDRVNVTVEKASGVTVVQRVMLSADHRTMAAIYQFVKHSPKSGKTTDLRVCDLETELTDGRFFTTANTLETNLASLPPQILSTKHPAATPLAELVRRHNEELDLLLQSASAATAVDIHDLEELNQSQRRQQEIKSAFRKQVGYVDPAEVQRIARRNAPDDPYLPAAASAQFEIAKKLAEMEEHDRQDQEPGSSSNSSTK